ncbi:MAG: peroxiredoxin [Nitrospinae bacterium]|nr:peroxiredoxin [Nitrospinota bacterium]
MGVLVGRMAPDFTADAVVNGNFEKLTLSSFKKKKYVILFFYPLDFTFVCPTELHAFQDKLAEFKKRDAEVIGVSVDSKYSHLAWMNTPVKDGGIKGVTYPIVADLTKSISTNYDVLEEGNGKAYRGLFLIDKNGIVQHQVVNAMELGRNIAEELRMLEALQYHEKHGEVCPANWTEGEKGMKEDQGGLKDYFKNK